MFVFLLCIDLWYLLLYCLLCLVHHLDPPSGRGLGGGKSQLRHSERAALSQRKLAHHNHTPFPTITPTHQFIAGL